MRRKNWRIVIAGLVLIVIALVFFFFMLSVASKSNDPVALMRTVGTVAGAVSGIGGDGSSQKDAVAPDHG